MAGLAEWRALAATRWSIDAATDAGVFPTPGQVVVVGRGGPINVTFGGYSGPPVERRIYVPVPIDRPGGGGGMRA